MKSMNITRTCSKCKHLTNVPKELRSIENVLGGCFVDGHFTFTDSPACEDFDKIEDE